MEISRINLLGLPNDMLGVLADYVIQPSLETGYGGVPMACTCRKLRECVEQGWERRAKAIGQEQPPGTPWTKCREIVLVHAIEYARPLEAEEQRKMEQDFELDKQALGLTRLGLVKIAYSSDSWLDGQGRLALKRIDALEKAMAACRVQPEPAGGLGKVFTCAGYTPPDSVDIAGQAPIAVFNQLIAFEVSEFEGWEGTAEIATRSAAFKAWMGRSSTSRRARYEEHAWSIPKWAQALALGLGAYGCYRIARFFLKK